MKIYMTTDGMVHTEMTPDEADLIRACLFREGRSPTSPRVQEYRQKLYSMLHPDMATRSAKFDKFGNCWE